MNIDITIKNIIMQVGYTIKLMILLLLTIIAIPMIVLGEFIESIYGKFK